MKLLLTAVTVFIGSVIYASDAPPAGSAAPEFSLPDANGKTHSLSEYKGKYVVLEWFNPECPFVKKHYGTGNMQKLQQEYTSKGIVWLTIDSNAPGTQGNLTPEQAQKIMASWKTHQTALLLDSDSNVARGYGAKNTPDMIVINPEGKIVYEGAIDSKATPNPADIPSSTNYVKNALDESLGGKPISNAQTKPYGCSVKYALISNIAAGSTENAGSTTNLSDAVAARTSVFKVLLQCKADPKLACGGGLKPILLKLERTPAIEQAWVNRNGTALLMIGSKDSTSASRAQAVQAVVGRRGRQVEELNGDDRNKVMDDFRSGSGWYRGEGVDELSRQAAKAVAARFLRRTKAKVSLSAAKAADLEGVLSTLLQTAFVDHPERDPPIEDVLKIGRARLDDAAFLAFKEAVESGIYPMPNEG